MIRGTWVRMTLRGVQWATCFAILLLLVACAGPAHPRGPVLPSDWSITSGTAELLPGGRLRTRSPTLRALWGKKPAESIQIDFIYRGPTQEVAPLASGELRRQLGLKLRAQDTCNVLYVMWHVAPTEGIHVSVKVNPGQHEHWQCRDGGYQGIEPTWTHPHIEPLRNGQRRSLSAEVKGNELRVNVDGAPAWVGKLPAQTFSFDGPPGVRSDNVEFEFNAQVPMQRPSGEMAPLALAASGSSDNSSEFTSARPLGVGYLDEIGGLPQKVAYFTFDDGPSEPTADILDILKAKSAKATFFVVARGSKGAAGLEATYRNRSGISVKYQSILKRVIDEGHSIGNHTVNHLDLAQLDTRAIEVEFDLNEELINQALVSEGSAPRQLTLLRAPFGSPWRSHAAHDNAAFSRVGRALSDRGVNVLWTVDSTDSQEWCQGELLSTDRSRVHVDPSAPSFAQKVARIKQSVLSDPTVVAKMGVIVLFHDTHDTTRAALSDIIDGFRQAGYSFGTLEDYVVTRWGSVTRKPRLSQ